VSAKSNRQFPPWVWGLITVLAVGAVVLLASGDRRSEPSQAFRYEIGEYEKIDPALVTHTELPSIDPGISALSALATSAGGRIYAAGTGVLAVYDLDGAELVRHAIFGQPNCLAVSPDGEIFLGMDDHVEVLDSTGESKAVWPNLGDRAHVTSITASGEDVYVADAGNRVVVRLDRQGKVLARMGKKDADKDIPGFIVPSPCFDVAFDNAGALWAVNPGRHGLENYRSTGELVTAWYRPSMELDGFCGCCNPAHVAFRSDGSLITAEKGLARVKVYSVDQKLLGVVAPPEAFHESPLGAFSEEVEVHFLDLAVDARNRVLLLDGRRNVIRVFQEKGAS
jgi:hypothetical protein